MPIADLSNPATIIFLIENYEKEKRLRLNWITKNKEKVEQAAVLTRPPTNYFESDVISYGMVCGMAAIKRDHISSARNKMKTPIRDGVFIPGIKDLRRGHSIVDIGLGDPKEDPRLIRTDSENDLRPDPIMRPVDPELTKLIYTTKGGREEYLEKRQKTLPENRYYFSQCSSWDYGWRIRDSKLVGRPLHGRCWKLARALKSRVGPTPDPDYYKDSNLPGPSKCVQ